VGRIALAGDVRTRAVQYTIPLRKRVGARSKIRIFILGARTSAPTRRQASGWRSSRISHAASPLPSQQLDLLEVRQPLQLEAQEQQLGQMALPEAARLRPSRCGASGLLAKFTAKYRATHADALREIRSGGGGGEAAAGAGRSPGWPAEYGYLPSSAPGNDKNLMDSCAVWRIRPAPAYLYPELLPLGATRQVGLADELSTGGERDERRVHALGRCGQDAGRATTPHCH
jgi:hypothetical protein